MASTPKFGAVVVALTVAEKDCLPDEFVAKLIWLFPINITYSV